MLPEQRCLLGRAKKLRAPHQHVGLKIMRKIIPAIPTIVISSVLAVDFAGTLNRLYLAVFGYYFGFLAIIIILFFIFLIKTKNFRSTSSLAFFLLLIASISFLIIESPVSSFIKNFTSLNRAFAVVKDEYKGNDFFEFTITAQGKGSWESFQLNSGYTNISVNGDYKNGPSLNYKLKPEIRILDRSQGPCEDPIEYSLEEAYDRNELSGISTNTHFSRFSSVLKNLAQVNDTESFDITFSEYKSSTIGMIPDENTVYRICFFLISIGSAALSFALSKDYGLEAQPTNSVDAKSSATD
jgi:hypothetical protein